MKRKLALLLAAVMALTVVPATSAAAATSNSLTKVPTIVGYSALFEEGWLATEKSANNYGNGPTTAQKSMEVSGLCADVDYIIDGTDLVIQVSQTNKLKAGDRFKVVLDNAVWFFRGSFPQSDLSLIARVSDVQNVHYRQPFSVLSYINGGAFYARPRTFSQDQTTSWAYSRRPIFTVVDGEREFAGWDTDADGILLLDWHEEPLMANAVPSLAGGTVPLLDGEFDPYLSWEDNVTSFSPLYVPTLGRTDGDQPLGAFTVIPTSDSNTWSPAVTGTYWRGGLTYDPRKGIWGSSNYIDSAGDPIEGDYYRLPQIMFPGNVEPDAGIGLDAFGILDTKAGEPAPYGQGAWEAGYILPEVDNNVYGNNPTGRGSWNNVREVPYKLSVNHLQDNEAVITILNDVYDPTSEADGNGGSPDPLDVPRIVTEYGGQGQYHEVRIPLVIRTTEEKEDVKVKIDPQNIAAISSGTWLFSQTSGGGTVTVADGIDTARENFWIDTLKVKEVRIGSIPSEGIFFLKTADHFEWRDPNSDATFAEVGVLHGLSWGLWTWPLSINESLVYNEYPRVGLGYRRLFWADASATGYSGFLWNAVGTAGNHVYDQYRNDWSSRVAVAGDYEVGYRITGTNPLQYDKKIIEVAYRGIIPSTDVPGAIYITGLQFVAEENAPYGDIMFSIGNVSSNKPVTAEKFKAGVRADWDIILKAEGTIPELINGRYRSENPIYSEDGLHKTAKVYFGEASVAAWWAERQTVFSLNEQAKFRRVEILEVNELPTAYEDALLGRYESNWKDVDGNFVAGPGHPTDDGVYINDGEKHGYVVVNGNTMTWNDLKIKPDKRASVRFDTWVSIESGFEGDVKLSVAGSAIPEQSNGNGVPAITIAKAISPIKVVAKVKDIKIGYQFQQTEDIIITETKAGMLEKDKPVYVSVSDLISSDLAFSNETKVAVTAGNLKIKDINASGIGYNALARQGDTLIAGQGGTINFTVSAASSAASTITISNVAVKIDRTVPESNLKPYKVVVWGPTVAPNYIYHNYNKFARDKFGTPGIMTDYIKVVSAANDKTNVLTQEVKVTIGERYFTVNGVTEEMDAEAYISTASNSTMVPVRFISKAFGLKDEQVIWDDANKTVTILSPIRVVQFQANSTSMKLDGVAVEMYSPDRKAVAAEIVNARMYVPFRAMGEAFGVNVVWDEANKTAIYNPKVSASTEAAPAAAAEAAAAPAAPATR